MSDDDSDTPFDSFFSKRVKFTPHKTPEELKAAAELVKKIEEENNMLKKETLPKGDQNVPKIEELVPVPVAKKGRKKKVDVMSGGAKNDFNKDDDLENVRLSAAAKRRLKKHRKNLEMDLALVDAQNLKVFESKFDDPLDMPVEEPNVPEEKVMNLTITYLSKVARFKCHEDEDFSKVFDDVANFFNLVPKEFLLCLRDRNITLTDTPKSISVTERDILECIPYKPSEPALDDENCFMVTFQSNDRKTKLEMVINKMEKMQTIMDRYCKMRGLPLNKLAFEFDGEKLSGNETPAELDMEPENCIDVRVFAPVARCSCGSYGGMAAAQCSCGSYGDMAVASCSYATGDTAVASSSYATGDMAVPGCSYATGDMAVPGCSYASGDMAVPGCSYATGDTAVAGCSYASDDMPAASSRFSVFNDDYLQNFVFDSDDSDIQILD